MTTAFSAQRLQMWCFHSRFVWLLPLMLCHGLMAQPRSLERQLDPLVVPGAMLPSLLETPLEKLGCFRAKASLDGTLEPIPCQVDERTARGAYVLPFGPDSNPEDSDLKLSARDELVFVASDAGGKVEQPRWPAGLVEGLELELRDPLDGALAWIYLGAFEGPAPRSSVDYVRYIPGSEVVDASTYQLRFSKDAPIVFDHLAIKTGAGGDGSNPVDRMKIRLDAKVWGTISIQKTEADYTSEVIGYLDGPVRVLRRTRNRLIIWWKIPSPSAIQDNYFYGTHFEFPISVTLPMDLDAFLSEATLRISVDLKGSPRRVFFNEHNPEPVAIDGRWTAAEAGLDLRPYTWSVLHGTRSNDSAGWFNRLSIGANTPIDPYLYYRDNAQQADAPEGIPGQVGDLGYEVRNLKGLTKGTHYLTSVLYHMPKYSPELVRRYLSIRHHPLQVRVPRVMPPSSAP